MRDMNGANEFILKLGVDGRLNVFYPVSDPLCLLPLVPVQQGDASSVTSRIADSVDVF